MVKINKNRPHKENFHLKPLPQSFLNNIAKHQNKAMVKNIWLENIGIKGINKDHSCFKNKEFIEYNQTLNESPIQMIAINILFKKNPLKIKK